MMKLLKREVSIEKIGARMSQIDVHIAGAVIAAVTELRAIAREVASEYGPPKKLIGHVDLLELVNYQQEGRIVDLHVKALGHRGRLGDELDCYADGLMQTLLSYEQAEREALNAEERR